MLVTDIKHRALEATITGKKGILYLLKATDAELNEVVNIGIGYILSLKRRTLVLFVVRHREEIRWGFPWWTAALQ